MNGTPLPPSSARNSGPGQERGFALLTVIVIVMALTILGLSLFSLSSFEARFFRPAQNNAQAVQSGRGAVDWARYVLESTDDLDSVRIATPPAGITGVIARRGTDFDSGDSTGYVFPPSGVDPDPIWVRAVASQGNQESAVLARFTPSAGQNIYKRLMTIMDSLVIKRDDDPERFNNTLLYGNIRIGQMQVVDYAKAPINLDEILDVVCFAQQAFPEPEADLGPGAAWWQEKYAAAQYVPDGGPMTIGPTGTAPGIYRTDPGAQLPDRYWSAVLEGDECNVNVRGTSIWMFPDGLRCNDRLQLTNVGAGDATVIMVSRPGPGSGLESDVGFALLGGITTANKVNVFMVSTGAVEIEQSQPNWKAKGSSVGYLSIYADWVKLMGPQGGAENMDLLHGNTTCNEVPSQDAKDGLVDQLIEANLLPNSRFARRRLTFIPGTWNENPTPVGN